MMGSRGRGGRARTAGLLGLFLAHSAIIISGISRFSGSGARLSRHSALGMPARRAVTWVTGQGPFAPQEVPCAFQGSTALLPKARERRKFIRACCFKGTLRCHRATAPACVCACGCGVSSAAWAGAAWSHTHAARTHHSETHVRAHCTLQHVRKRKQPRSRTNGRNPPRTRRQRAGPALGAGEQRWYRKPPSTRPRRRRVAGRPAAHRLRQRRRTT